MRRRLGPGWGSALIAAGLVWMTVAGLRSSRYRPGWFDPDDGPSCAFRPEGCPADLDAALRGLWWWVGAGGVLTLLGVVLLTLALPSTTSRSGARAAARPRPAGLHALAAAAVVAGATVVLALPAWFSLLLGEHLLPMVAVGGWLAEAVLLAAVHAWATAVSSRRSWAAGLTASAAGLAAAVPVSLAGVHLGDAWAVLLAQGVAVAGAVLVTRAVAGPWRTARAGTGLRVAGVLAVLAIVAGVLVAATSTVEQDRVAAFPSLPEPAYPPPDAVPPPVPVPPAPTVPEATPPEPVLADVPCDPADLLLSVGGFDAALGARAASVEATNAGAAPCWLEGVPAVTLWQGGRPLRLVVEPGSVPTGGPAVVQRVGIAPGGSAYALLTWRTYAGWADDVTPQSVTVAVDPSALPVEVRVEGRGQPAPFDIADGGTWGIAPWAPPWN
ncbi:DUF4232 domain-containing protein [Blastococcus sp. TF02A-26]|uniref:DUF4232 domain-containing protein n=1 Tax=Blastococcus sp. TF02A-26 TaxID=2250577 RepID=UPI000DE82BE2|nr:DUF4232 domain-containing protein [Blastococcus sp. TF02A-26]